MDVDTVLTILQIFAWVYLVSFTIVGAAILYGGYRGLCWILKGRQKS